MYCLWFMGHQIERYAALVANWGCFCRKASGVINPCRSISRMVL
jgi:hypothetical protein